MNYVNNELVGRRIEALIDNPFGGTNWVKKGDIGTIITSNATVNGKTQLSVSFPGKIMNYSMTLSENYNDRVRLIEKEPIYEIY